MGLTHPAAALLPCTPKQGVQPKAPRPCPRRSRSPGRPGCCRKSAQTLPGCPRSAPAPDRLPALHASRCLGRLRRWQCRRHSLACCRRPLQCARARVCRRGGGRLLVCRRSPVPDYAAHGACSAAGWGAGGRGRGGALMALACPPMQCGGLAANSSDHLLPPAGRPPVPFSDSGHHGLRSHGSQGARRRARCHGAGTRGKLRAAGRPWRVKRVPETLARVVRPAAGRALAPIWCRLPAGAAALAPVC
jgi:hypothetical protein